MYSEKPKELTRKHLEKILDVITEKALTIVVGPSGYGKTTMVRSFFQRDVKKKYIWFSLSRAETDDTWVWLKFCSCFSDISPELCTQMKELGFPDTVQKQEYLMQIIVKNTLDTFYLILDDFQEYESKKINQLLTYLVNKGLPNLHIILITKEFPNISYEAMMLKDYCSVIDQRQLVLSKEESEALFRINGIILSENEKKELYGYTNGWIAAVSLSILEYRKTGQLGYYSSIAHLLKTTIINGFSKTMQEILMKMSLFDDFTLEEAVYVSGSNIHAAVFYEIAEQFNFINYDMKSKKCRLHGLLRNALLTELEKSEIDQNGIYRLGGEYHEKQESYADAIVYYQKSEDIEKILQILSENDSISIYASAPRLMNEIFNQIPLSMKLKYPTAYLMYIYYLIVKEDVSSGEKMLRELQEVYGSAQDIESKRMQGEICILRALLSFYDLEKTNNSLKHAYKLFSHGSSRIFKDTVLNYGLPYTTMVYHNRAGFLKKTIEREKEYSRYYLKVINGVNGDWDELFEAEYRFTIGDIEIAKTLAERTVEKAKFRNQICFLISGYYLQLRCLIYLGREQEFNHRMKELDERMQKTAWSMQFLDYELAYSYVYACIGRTDKIVSWIKELQLENCNRVIRSIRSGCIVHGVMLRQKKNWLLLNEVAERMLQPYESITFIYVLIYAYIYKGIAIYHIEGIEQAQKYIHKAIILAEPDGIRMPFVENSVELNKIMKSCAGKNTFFKELAPYIRQYQNSLKVFDRETVILTPREEELLELVKQGYTNNEISKKLNIALVTVEKNLTQIYRKLGVSNRVAAIARLESM